MNEPDLKALLADAKMLRSQKRLEAANDRLERALSAAREEPRYASSVALSLWQVGRLDEMIGLLEGAVKTLDSSPERGEIPVFLTRVGAAHIRLGRLQTAVNRLYDALELADNGYTALQLGNALRYLGAFGEAAGHLTRAFHKAKAGRDGALAIAALCAQGELALDEGGAQGALELFGKALGLTELSSVESLSIAPLAGLSQAHAAWENPKKAGDVGEKAFRRADAAEDGVGRARALLSLGLAKRDDDLLKRSWREAENAPHRPLALRAKVARLELNLQPQDQEIDGAVREAEAMGMRVEAERLRTLL